MKNRFVAYCTAVCITLAGAASFNAQAQSEASALSAVSALPIASVVVGGSAAAGAVVAIPVVLSTAGAVLVVKTVESTARGTLYVLERASDGARASIEVVGRGVAGASMADRGQRDQPYADRVQAVLGRKDDVARAQRVGGNQFAAVARIERHTLEAQCGRAAGFMRLDSRGATAQRQHGDQGQCPCKSCESAHVFPPSNWVGAGCKLRAWLAQPGILWRTNRFRAT